MNFRLVFQSVSLTLLALGAGQSMLSMELPTLKDAENAIKNGNLFAVRDFIQTGGNVNECNKLGKTLLHTACCYKDLEVIKTLIENGANLNQPDRIGETPLHYAATIGNINIINLLLKNGADSSCKNSFGRTMLYNVRLWHTNSEMEQLVIKAIKEQHEIR
jgi:hypothetical protein